MDDSVDSDEDPVCLNRIWHWKKKVSDPDPEPEPHKGLGGLLLNFKSRQIA